MCVCVVSMCVCVGVYVSVYVYRCVSVCSCVYGEWGDPVGRSLDTEAIRQVERTEAIALSRTLQLAVSEPGVLYLNNAAYSHLLFETLVTH